MLLVGVDRPDRGERRRRGKSDPIDAEAAALESQPVPTACTVPR